MKRLGIIVPFRDRYEHLHEFIPALTLYLEEKEIDYRIIVVEQDNASAFNRGMLCNIGFKEAVKNRCGHVVFHDVDMIPVNIDYSPADHPVHLATDNLPFETYFGGITLFPVEDFKKINGFSNFYWGWGFEDDDLRYRSIKAGLKFNKLVTPLSGANKKQLLFNGINSYVKLKNTLNINRDFTIEILVKNQQLQFDPTQQFDSFPIFNIQGSDFNLEYNSFKRFKLSFFDRRNTYYDIFSNVTEKIENYITIKYTYSDNTIDFYINRVKVGEIKLKYRLYNYNKAENIYLGSDSSLENFYKGAITYFRLTNNTFEITKLDNTLKPGYELKDHSGKNNHGQIVKAYFKKNAFPEEQIEYIPFRREGNIRKLRHTSNGFNKGRWKSDLTRWNELRYTNEVLQGSHDDLEDGLSTCQYTHQGKKRIGKVIHLNVGI